MASQGSGLCSCCHPDCKRAMTSKEEHNASERAAMVAVNLISSARVILGLDSEFTEYSAQYLVDNAGPKKELGQRELEQQRRGVTMQDCVEYLRDIANPNSQGETDQQPRRELTVKDCLECAFREGIPRQEHWGHLGCVFKVPPFASLIPRVPMKGEVIEAKELEEAFELLGKQPVGAKLHVFSPQIDSVGEGVYDGPGEGTSYVGLRDVIICSVEKFKGDSIANVKICYKKKTSFMKVSLTRMFAKLSSDGDESQGIMPTGLLVDFIIPRLSK
ncbi:unnamed protein product [Microthlaspi erraticum]|uniref:Uncharacterized protein n=1 Tax=Microthlaspi erraticum TaxID=1685480 RepID=A0A6D2IPT0_9BRAS|nr:unnamed protein product [Microthlaspi erraticum]CAA7029094.1 unnamed protein product [Microthlaspi erraticum]